MTTNHPYRTPVTPPRLDPPPSPSDPAFAGGARFREHMLAALKAHAACEAELDRLEAKDQRT